MDGEFDVGVSGGVGREVCAAGVVGCLRVAGLWRRGYGEAANRGDIGDGEVDVLAGEVVDVRLREMALVHNSGSTLRCENGQRQQLVGWQEQTK